MHEYLRAVGFSRIESKEQLNQLLNMTEESYQTERTAVSANGNDFSERKKEFAPRMGIMLRGEYDEKGDYQRDYYFPYFMGTQEKFYDNISIERHAEKESYAGVCEDLSMGVTIIFYLQNIVDYLSEQRMNRNLLPPGTATIRFSGLSIDGRILLPVAKRMTEEENTEAILQRTRLLKAAREGDEEAIENLTLEDMDTYSMISRRIGKEDILSIVTTYFMPYGIESDKYSILGNIMAYRRYYNHISMEEVVVLTVESNDLTFDVCINRKDLLGEPEVGRRFKGTVWMQGSVEIQS